MTKQITSGIGLRHVRVALRTSTGVAEMPSTHVVGTCYPGIQLSGAATLTITAPDPERVAARGDDQVYHTFHMPPTEGWTAELTCSKQDLQAIALMTGVALWDEPDLFTGLAMGTDLEGVEPDLIMWGQRKAADTGPASSTFGAELWEVLELLCCKITPKLPSREQSTVGQSTYAVTLQKVSTRIVGEPFTEEDHGCTKATAYPVVAEPGKAFYDWDVGDGVNIVQFDHLAGQQQPHRPTFVSSRWLAATQRNQVGFLLAINFAATRVRVRSPLEGCCQAF